ncbi:MAG: type VI secretion system baseplate subunit TssE [Planctomycetes bacterium]|nr:type VI secretion system baseplate subunit TssE [Planctomycetota bacterium]
MSERERLQPSLLDRLTDDDPSNPRESREERVLSPRQLRAGVLRDLSWLLNTGHLADLEDLSAYPEIQRSVINYGTPDLSGCASSGLDIAEIERAVRQSIIDFEPRIIPSTVRVRAVVSEAMNTNALRFEITGDLWAEPLPEHLFLRTDIDLESGSAEVRETRGPD